MSKKDFEIEALSFDEVSFISTANVVDDFYIPLVGVEIDGIAFHGDINEYLDDLLLQG